MTTVFNGLDQIRAAAGTHLGHSEWLTIEQDRIDLFAIATHGAAAPRGLPIADGLLLVALSNMFLPQIVEVRGVALGINYGTNKIRFQCPVHVGQRVRGGAQLVEVAEVNGGVQTLIRITIEIDGQPDPACVIDSLSRWLDG